MAGCNDCMDKIDPLGVCDVLKVYARWIALVTFLVGVLLLAVGTVLYRRDYAPFHSLDDFSVTVRWIVPRPACIYNGKLFDCYDAYVLGNYTWSGTAHSCQLFVAEEFQWSEANDALNRAFPQLGHYSMWSATPLVDNNCVQSVDSHCLFFVFGGLLTGFVVLWLLSLGIRKLVHYFKQRKTTRRTLDRIHFTYNRRPPLGSTRAQP